MGGTMRCGQRRTIFKKKEGSIMWQMYGKHDEVSERHRHRFVASVFTTIIQKIMIYNSKNIFNAT